MEISVANQRILVFSDQVSKSDAAGKAWVKKVEAFGAISVVGSFFSKPKDDDFELIYQEHRYQPFWHVVAEARYVYDRNASYEVKAGGSEVKKVTVETSDFEINNSHFHLPVQEHCIQEEKEEVYVDGVSGKNHPELARYLSLSPKEVSGELSAMVEKDSILVPPQSRVSAIMRDALAKMIKGIQADTIHEEAVKVPCVDLYYRPVYAFQYKWKSKNKDAIVEVDAVTGDVAPGSRIFSEYMGKVLDKNFLFDLGADAAGMLIPGGSIAVKIAKKYIDSRGEK